MVARVLYISGIVCGFCAVSFPHAARWTRARGWADPLVPALFVAFALMLAAQVGASDMAAATVAGTREAYVLLAFVAAAGSPVRRSWLCGSIAGRTRFVRKAVAPSVWDVCARRVMG